MSASLYQLYQYAISSDAMDLMVREKDNWNALIRLHLLRRLLRIHKDVLLHCR
jgi:hypothetical protein